MAIEDDGREIAKYRKENYRLGGMPDKPPPVFDNQHYDPDYHNRAHADKAEKYPDQFDK